MRCELGTPANNIALPIEAGSDLPAQADYLSMSLGDYDGELFNLQAEASYSLSRQLRIGVMSRHVDYAVEVEKRRFVGRISYRFTGPSIFLELGF